MKGRSKYFEQLREYCEGIPLVDCHDHTGACGFGSAVLEAAAVALPRIPRPITVLAMPNRFIKHDSRDAQLIEAGINADKIAQTAKQMLSLAE